MPNINFDGVARRDAKEPQITKAQLLEPPAHAASPTGWGTPRSIYGVGDLVANDASWNFDALDTTETPSSNSTAPVKREPTTPAPGFAQHNDQYDSHNDDIYFTASKNSRETDVATGRQASGTSSDDKYGHKTGVIDLTADDSDDEQDLAMPERQFVPRAELDSAASSFPPQKTSSPPRTFTKGLEPIAAHPRKPPIVHRQKPPIKPPGKQRRTVSSSPLPTVPAVQAVFTKRRRLLSTQPTNFRFSSTPDRSSSTVRTLECTPLDYSTDSKDQTPGRETDPIEETDAIREQTPVPSVAKNPSGPFFEEDFSSEDEEEAAAVPEVPDVTEEDKPRPSVTRLLKRPRSDAPTRATHDDILEQSRAMRAKARERAQEDLATRANTVAPDTNNTAFDQSDERAFLGLPRRRRMP